MKNSIDNLITGLKRLDDYNLRQESAINALKEFTDLKDYKSVAKLAEYVVGEPEENDKFTPWLKMQSLEWLTSYYIDLTHDFNGSNEDEENEIWGKFTDCIWKYKWIVPKLGYDIDIDKEYINNANKSMKHYYKQCDFSLSSVYKAFMLQAMNMGDIQSAKENFTKWQEFSDDEMSDCKACNVAELVNYYNFIGKHKEALELSKPLLSGEMTCAEVPHISYYAIVNSLMQLLKWQEAKDVLNLAIKHIIDSNRFDLLAKLIQLKVILDEKDDAKNLLDKYSENIYNANFAGAYFFLQFLMAIAVFNDKALDDSRALAREFDKRNGNRYFENQIDLLLA